MTNGDATIEIIEQFFAKGELPDGLKLSEPEQLLLLAVKQVRTEVRRDIKEVADFTWGKDKDPRDEKSINYKVSRNSRIITAGIWAGGIILVAILGAIGSSIADGMLGV